jgi:hypothetical protein
MTAPFINNLATSAQHQLSTLLEHLLDQNIDWVGIYLHGSLAMGCFNPASSDIDLVAVSREKLSLEEKAGLVRILLRTSNHPHPVEISFVNSAQLTSWRYPPPFDLHYSETWRPNLLSDLVNNKWQEWPQEEQVDPDLAAHYTVMRRRGKKIWGRPVLDIFPQVPREDYLRSLKEDFNWAQAQGSLLGVYQVLNLCRTYAYCLDGRIRSKAEGGEWGLKNLPAQYTAGITAALSTYRGTNTQLPAGFLEEFTAEYLPKIV